ncbi:MAG: 4Fe-4S ferredoxin, partial [Desulfitobacterium hafniense]|nr:4Fe-4S ferredoxin [Desulfitobacterium hafniense]
MNQLIKEMRDTARELLSSGTVKTVIGWAKGSRWYLTPPVFLNNAEEVDRLYYDQFAVNNLTGYLLDYRDSDDKIAVFVKGCDSRGIIRLIQDNQINQDRVVVIGVPCGGMLDKAEVKDHRNPHVLSLLPKCLECRYPNPVYANITVGGVRVCHEPGEPTGNVLNLLTAKNVGSKKNERFSNVREIMAMDSEEKYEF